MSLAIIGSVGAPSRYGGFETLVEQLILFAHRNMPDFVSQITVYCSSQHYDEKLKEYFGAKLKYSAFNANGPQSILYDFVTAIRAVFSGHQRLLFLGVSGALISPFIRIFTQRQIILHLDGLEWKRRKFGVFSRFVLRSFEFIGVHFAHELVGDNEGICTYLKQKYGRDANEIAYGGCHTIEKELTTIKPMSLPEDFALVLCRIEPENSIDYILEAFSKSELNILLVGNWDASAFGIQMRERYQRCGNISFSNPIYDPSILRHLRSSASFYVHGHSVGGTNPSLVEMMYSGKTVLAYDCIFNRHTTENNASYFSSADSLVKLLKEIERGEMRINGPAMQEIAKRRYTWEKVGRAYFDLLTKA